jgi:hypothetical protein
VGREAAGVRRTMAKADATITESFRIAAAVVGGIPDSRRKLRHALGTGTKECRYGGNEE